MCWSALSDAVPLYPLYALLFADSGLSEAEISSLFALWSAVAVLAEVPCGAWADRNSRRSALVAAGALQALGYLFWIAWPSFGGFATGFVLWGVGGALSSGSIQALVHDGLAAAGAEQHYAAVMGSAEAAGLAVQVPLAGAASLLFWLGGYALAGWVSVGVCLAASALAFRLPEARLGSAGNDDASQLATLRVGFAEVAGSAGLRGVALGVAVLTGLVALEEYFPLLGAQWGVSAGAIPIALLGISLAGALGATLGGRAMALGPRALTAAMLAPAGFLLVSGLAARPAGLVGLAVVYGLQQLTLVVADARLQARIAGPSRATITSVAAVGGELTAIVVVGAWALGGLTLVAALAAVAALALGGRLSAPGRGR